MLLFVENQDKNRLYTIGSNCRIKLDKGTSIHRIYITFPAITGSEEIAKYSSYDKAQEVYRDLVRHLTIDSQFRSNYFTMPEDSNLSQ